MRSSATSAPRERRTRARGWIWSQPKPVLGAKVSQALSSALTHSGGSSSPSVAGQTGQGSSASTRQTEAHLAASKSTTC